MEDKKYYKDELQKLGIENLESVAGGVLHDQLTDAERHECKALRKKCEKAVLDKGKGLCGQDTVDAAYREYMEFMRKMNNKYS